MTADDVPEYAAEAREWSRHAHNYAVICLALEKARREVERLEQSRDEIMAGLSKVGSRSTRQVTQKGETNG